MLESHERSRPRAPLIAAAVAVLLGVLAGRAGITPVWGTALGVGVAAGVAALRFRRGAQGLALVALAGLAAERAAAWAPAASAVPVEPIRMEACVEQMRAAGSRAPVWTGIAGTRDDGGVARRLRLVLPVEGEGGEAPEPGTRIRLLGRVRTAGAPQNPGEADPRRGDADAGIQGVVWADAWRPVGRCDGFAIGAALARGRRAFGRVVRQALPEREAGLALALAAGDASGVDAAAFDAFQATGTVHVLSVSGMHLALVTFAVFAGVRVLAMAVGRARASAYDLRAAAAVAALMAAAAYSGFAGLSLATARALVATALVCAAALLGGGSSAWNAWAAAIGALLLASPPAVRSPTFALSFLAVAGILAAGRSASGPRFDLSGDGLGAWGAAVARWAAGQARVWPAATARMTAGAAAATAPVIAALFGRIPAVGLAANAAAIPLFSLALAPLLAGAAVLPLSEGAARVFIASAWPFLAAGSWIVERTAEAPLCWLDATLPAAGAAALSAAVFGALLARGRLRVALVSSALGVAAVFAAMPYRAPPTMEVTFLAAGQGDAAVVRFADGGVLLVDTGPDPAGRRVVVPFLRALGVRHLDAVAISHAHPDHTGGLADVLRSFPVRELWLAGPVGSDPGLDAAEAPLVARGTRIVAVGRDAPARRFGDATVEFLAGKPTLRRERPDERAGRNDRSLVMRVSGGGMTVLFAGDLEGAGERALLASDEIAAADVVKVAHHGSATSSHGAFVRASAARLAVASAGRGNHFGFPAPEVTARWRASGAGWLDTAADGAITVFPCGNAKRGGSGGKSRVCARTFVDSGRTVRY